MNFPKFWALGKSEDFSCWRWSSASLAEAQSLANEAARALAERFRSGNYPTKHGYYSDRPFREQVLQEIKNGNDVAAVVTRNSYGCLVLNTARVMFVDIDLPEPPKPRGGGFLARLFGKPTPPPPVTPQGPEEEALARVESWTSNNYQWGWRVYRTRAGLRLLATHAPVEVDSRTTEDIFHALGADPLYRKLCKNQKCYRARLTPKPWRCGAGKPNRWPWLTPKEEQRFQKWQAKYQETCQEWATCNLLRQIGNATVHPQVQSILKLHDDSTRVDSNLQLA